MKKIIVTLFSLFFVLACAGVTSKAANVNEITDTDTSTLDSLTTSEQNSGSINNEATSQTSSGEATTETTTSENLSPSDDITSDLLPEVSTDGFFKKLYNKLWGAAGGVQKIVFIIIIVFLVIDLLFLVGSIFSKKNIGFYIIGLVICVVAALADIYIVDIVAGINSWLKN